jgi:hypothetical protein
MELNLTTNTHDTLAVPPLRTPGNPDRESRSLRYNPADFAVGSDRGQRDGDRAMTQGQDVVPGCGLRTWNACCGFNETGLVGVGVAGSSVRQTSLRLPLAGSIRVRAPAFRMTAMGVCRDKAALSSGCKAHPATAPAGSNRSRHGGDEMSEAFG